MYSLLFHAGYSYSMSMTDEKRDEQQGNSAQSISRLLDTLIDGRGLVEDTRAEVEQFRNSQVRPEAMGRTFNGAEELAEHLVAHERYDEALGKLMAAHEEAERIYESAKTEVATLLPVGSSVEHDYGGNNETLSGRYRIIHDEAGIKVVSGR
jgi:hypothetical protein